MMVKHQINYESLDNVVNRKTFKLSEVKDKLVKVAFDVYKMKNGDPEELWQVQNSDDGDYIVARYNDEVEKEVKVAVASVISPWEVSASESDVSIFYKGYPISKISLASLGMKNEDADSITSFLPGKLASDKNLVKALVNDLNEKVKNKIIQMYPELV
jgi:hypothetical protein